MNKDTLTSTVSRLVASGKGILAIDESVATCSKRFEKLGVEPTEEKRREYRELLVTAPEIEKYISGYITFDETLRQVTKEGKTFPSILQSKGVDVGIKVDTGTKDLPEHPGEKFTEGLEGLPERLNEYKTFGATFAKWRAVYSISERTPSEDCMKVNAEGLAKYAAMCQAADIVPIVEPEVLMDGEHTIEKSLEVTGKNLGVLFTALKNENVFLPGVILKTSMVIPGNESGVTATPEQVAEFTLRCLKEHVPKEIGGIVFLSGGQSDEEAALNLNAMHKMGDLPWPLSFSYGRAIQNPCLQAWAKNQSDFASAQALLLERAKANSEASLGQYK